MRFTLSSFAFCAAFLSIAFFTTSVFAADSDLDATFDADGKVTTTNFFEEGGRDVVIQPDGKIVVVGGKTSTFNVQNFAAVRYNANGSLDTSFGTGGIYVLPTLIGGVVAAGKAAAVDLQPDGKILLAGTGGTNSSSNQIFLIIRLNTNGTLDTTFGSGGRVIKDIGKPNSYGGLSAMLFDAVRSKIYLGGTTDISSDGSTYAYTVMRFNADGAIDTTFNGTGTQAFPVAESRPLATGINDIALQADGKIIAVGKTQYSIPNTPSIESFGTARINVDGTLDSSFGTNGIIITDFTYTDSGTTFYQNAAASTVSITPSGKIFVGGLGGSGSGGTIRNFYFAAQFNPNGSYDSSFGTNGKIRAEAIMISDSVITQSGKIVVIGEKNANFGVARLNQNGTIDSTFGTGGFVQTGFATGGTEYPIAAALQTDGKIVVSGGSRNPNTSGPGTDYQLVSRYTGTPVVTAPRGTWDGGGADNNWSTAANWGMDIVPTNSDNVIFDATSAKNAVVDTAFTVNSISIKSDFAGTVTQGTGANLTISSTFSQTGGAFQGGSGTLTINGNTTLSGGTFTGGTGLITYSSGTPIFQQSGGTFSTAGNVTFYRIFQTGGTFNAPAGTLTMFADLNIATAGGTFNANGGTIVVNSSYIVTQANQIFNNLTINSGYNTLGTTSLKINGTLSLVDGTLNGNPLITNGNVSYASTFDGGSAQLQFSDAATRTVNLPASNFLLGMMIDNPNITVTTSGAGASGFTGEVEVKRGLLQQGGVLTLNSTLRISGGTFQGSASAITNNGTYINIVISGGTFQSGSGAIAVGTINTMGGTFNGGSGDIEVSRYEQSGGIFNAPTGTITVVADWVHTASGTFNAGTSSVKMTGYNVYNCANSYTSDVNVTETYYNLEIANAFCDQRYIAAGDTLIVTNNLRLSAANIAGGKIRSLGTVTIDASNNGYAGSTVVEFVTPNTNFVINNPSSTVSMLPVEMNAANSTLTSSGAGRMNFSQVNLLNGTINQGAGIWDISTIYPGYSQSGGTYNGSAAEVLISQGTGNPLLSGGVFNSGAGKVTGDFRITGGTMNISGDMNTNALSIEGGIYNAPLGTLKLGSGGNCGFSHTLGGTFNARTGTVSANPCGFDVNVRENFNNLTFIGGSTIATNDTLIVNGAIVFNGGSSNGGSIEANGDVQYLNGGTGNTNGNPNNGTTVLRFVDTATRTINFNTSNQKFATLAMFVDNPNITINFGLSNNTLAIVNALILQRGTINQVAGRIGVLNDFTQTGGTFNAGTYNGAFNIPTTAFSNAFTLSGGDFNAGSFTQFFGNYTHTAGGNFNYGTGTVNFTATGGFYAPTIDVNATENFNNVQLSPANGLYRLEIPAGDNIIANGDLTFGGSGTVNGGTLEAKKNVVVNGGFGGGTTALTFTGATDQIFTNAGGNTTSGIWTINKPNSNGFADKSENKSAIAAPSTLFLNGNVGNSNTGGSLPLSYPNMNLVSGFVEQGSGTNLSLGSFSSALGTSFTNVNDGDLILAGNVTNNGFMNINGNGSACPQPDAILFRSSATGIQRNWNGSGTFRITDVDVRDQAGNALITAYSSTNTANNGANWSFTGSCLTTAAKVAIGGRATNAKGRGIANVRITLTENNGAVRQTITNAFGYYRFIEVRAGETYIIEAKAKRFQFSNSTQSVSVTEDLNNINFTALY